MSGGRPSDYTAEIADAICERLVNGESLKAIGRDAAMPSAATVCRWLAKHEEFRDQYARAREAQADTLADESLHIADTPMMGERVKVDDDGNEETVREDMLGHRKLQIDTRKWFAAKVAPKKYGDRIQQDHTINMSEEASSWLGQTF